MNQESSENIVSHNKTLIDFDAKLEQILSKLENLDKRLQKIEKSTGNMDRHIGFIERTYNVVKEPFVNLLSWNRPMILPAPESETLEADSVHDEIDKIFAE